MLVNFIREKVLQNSTQNFEKARMKATSSLDTNPPSPKDIESILLAFRNKDPEVRGCAAFYLVLAKMQATKPKKPWNYIVKNLVLFDRAIDEKCFAKEITELESNQIEHSEPGLKKNEKIGLFIKRYFRYIKGKGRIYNTEHFQFDLPLEQQKIVLKSIDKDNLLLEIKRLKSLIILALDVFEMNTSEILKYKLNQYVFLSILKTCVNIFSMQYLIFIVILEKLSDLIESKVFEFYEAFKEFFQDIDSLAMYCDKLKIIPDFKFSKDHVYDPQVAVIALKIIQDSIHKIQENKRGYCSVMTRRSLNLEGYNLGLKAHSNSVTFLKTSISQPTGDTLENSSENSALSEHSENIDRISEANNLSTNYLSICSPVKSKKSLLDCRLSYKTNNVFRNTFHVGFKTPLASHNCNKENLQVYSTQEKANCKAHYQRNRSSILTPSKTSSRLITPIFYELLHLEERDEVFDGFSNFYSYDFCQKTEFRYDSATRHEKKVNRFMIRVEIYTDENSNKDCSYEVRKFHEFNPDIFDNFKNNYSR